MTKPIARSSQAGISKSRSKTNQSMSSTPQTKVKDIKIYSSDNFPLKQSLLKEFMQKHPKIIEFLGDEPIQNFYKLLDQRFFQWLNHGENSQKTLYEIKREFMIIAETVLIFEVTNQQRRLTQFGFVIGPFQKILEEFAKECEPYNSEVIPYSKPLRVSPISKLKNTRRQIREDEIKLSGVEFIDDVGECDCDVSEFFK